MRNRKTDIKRIVARTRPECRTFVARGRGHCLHIPTRGRAENVRRSVEVFSNQLVNPANSSPADIHHYVIPPKLLLTNRLYFQQTSGIRAPVGKRKGGSLSGRSPASIADSYNVATIARKHSVLNLREINRNNTHTALASVLTYYG
jgi:hypothetical protein